MNTTVPCGVTSGEYVPPKNWAELNDSMKIERIREIIKSLQDYAFRLGEENRNLRKKLKAHKHDDKGMAFEQRELSEYDYEANSLANSLSPKGELSSNAGNYYF